jgi:hypothetical protein
MNKPIGFTRKEFEEEIYGEPIPDWFWNMLRRNYLEMTKEEIE